MNTPAPHAASTAAVGADSALAGRVADPVDTSRDFPLPGSPADAVDGWLRAADVASQAREMNNWAIALGDGIRRALAAGDATGVRDLLAIHLHLFTCHSGTVEAEEAAADSRLRRVRAAVYPNSAPHSVPGGAQGGAR